MEINKTMTVAVQAKTLKLYLKVCDNFTATIADQNGNDIGGQEDGYVPGFMPGEHYGDYVTLDIDIDSGHVTNWIKPTAKEIEDFLNKAEED